MREKRYIRNKFSLVKLSFHDMEEIRIWRNNQIQYLRQNKPLEKKDQKSYWKQLKNNNKVKLFSIISNSDENLVGYCGLTNINYEYSHAEMSFLTHELNHSSTWYKDIFTEVLDMLCDYGFNSIKLNRIFTETYEFRKNHLEILETFGFIKEGNLREHVFKNNRFYDSLIHSILKKEYKSRGKKNVL